MRALVCVLVIAWLVGIIAGVLHAVPALLTACIVTCIVLCYYLQFKVRYFVASAVLVLFGFMYGEAVANLPVNNCQGQTSSTGIITRVYALSYNQSQYVFKRDDGCSVLVFTSRYPVHVSGTRIQVVGSEQIAGQYLQDNGIDLVNRNARLQVLSESYSILDRMRIVIMERIPQLFGEPDASVLVAMIAGDRALLTQSIQDAFKIAGISHVLAISGLHISVLVGLLSLCMLVVPVSGRVRSIIMLVVLWTYISSIGVPPSALRAGIFWTMALLAYRSGLLVGLPTIIVAMLAIVTTYDPHIMLSVGFQLSVSAVLGIWIVLTIGPRRTNPVVGLALVSAGATLGTLPLILFYFHAISLVSIVVNMVVVPVIPAILFGSILALLVSSISVPFALLCSHIVHILFAWVLLVVDIVRHTPYAYAESIRFPGWAVFLYYGCVIGFVVLFLRIKKMNLRELWI